MKRLVTAGVLLAAMGGVAVAGTGVPSDWQMNMQGQVTELGRGVKSFHDLLLWIITAICLLVAVLLAIVIFRFREDKNPVPARTTHNTLLEVAWTVAPVAILVAIAIPSFRLLREQLVVPPADIVVKATGYAWYWGYEYPADQGGFKFDSNMVPESDLQPGQLRLLAVDNEMVVPVNKVVKVQVTAADVLHSFAVPAFAIKVDAVPGRLNETWFKADREGIYHGQCSELCGNGHPYMPIAVRVVSEQQYSAWLAEAKQKYAVAPTPTRVANSQ